MSLFRKIKPPCPKCPYTLRLVMFVKNPCPECKLDGYRMYDRLISQAAGRAADPRKLPEDRAETSDTMVGYQAEE